MSLHFPMNCSLVFTDKWMWFSQKCCLCNKNLYLVSWILWNLDTFYTSLSSCYFPLFHIAIMKIIKSKSKLTCNSTKNIKQYIISHSLLDKTHQAFSQVSCSCSAFSELQHPCRGCHLPWPRRSVRHHQEYRPWAWDGECSSASQYHWNVCPSEDRNFSSWFGAQRSPQTFFSCPWLLVGQQYSTQKGYHGGAYW